MSSELLGIHHVTAISRDPQATVDFYTQVLGLRLVKLTVNYDDPSTYHLYFANERGDPGTVLTFFPWPEAPRGQHGSGQVSTISFNIPENSTDFWTNRLKTHKLSVKPMLERFGEKIIPFNDPDGQNLELVVTTRGKWSPWRNGSVPVEYGIRGFHGVTLQEQALEDTESFMVDVLGFQSVGSEEDRFRYTVGKNDGSDGIVDVLAVPREPRGLISVGTVHHVAFRVADDKTQLSLRAKIQEVNPTVTPVINRNYFHSIYFREPGGVLFEAATDPPGFTVDESLDKLGTTLALPPWLEPQRDTIRKTLPKIRIPQLATAEAIS